MSKKWLAIMEPLERIASALERMSPASGPRELQKLEAEAYVWQAAGECLNPVHKVSRVALELLQGIDHTRDILLANTERFAKGLPANNALLWGARGMGKSSLVKAIHAKVHAENPLYLIEIHREDITSLPSLLNQLRPRQERFILFCDDLSFDTDDTSYKSLKAVLDGGLEGRPANVLLYATSNRRHLMPRDMMENERATAIHPSEAIQEKVSLSDRFGLWLGFHNCDQEDYLNMIRGYVKTYNIPVEDDELHAEAIEWTRTRGSRSGRVAWQFIQDLAGRKGVKIEG